MLLLTLLLCCGHGGDGSAQDLDGDGGDATVDCNDLDAAVGAAATWYADADRDGHGDPGTGTESCTPLSGFVADDTDCDDHDAATFPGAAAQDSETACETDADGDGFGAATAPAGGQAGTDCDDQRATVNPDGTESCATAFDDDCDGSDNDVDAAGCASFYADGDGDGFGGTAQACLCAASEAFPAATATDCDDTDAATYPGAAPRDSSAACETDADGDGYGSVDAPPGGTAGTDCDDRRAEVSPGAFEDCATEGDDDCTGSNHDPDAVGCGTLYADRDKDGFGAADSACLCAADAIFSAPDDTDCDDGDAQVHPGAVERCDTTADDDCDDNTNPEGALGCMSFFPDADGDGYGGTAGACLCVATDEHPRTDDTDCDDGDPAVHPGATETCDTPADDDCSGSNNDPGAVGCSVFYQDADLDGFGATISVCTCEAAGDYTATDATDCDDTEADAHPGGTEVVGNRVDEDCDGVAILALDDFEGGTDGAPVAGSGSWVCMAADCVSVYSSAVALDGLSLSTDNGGDEVGQMGLPLDQDFALDLFFYDPTGTDGAAFALFLWAGYPDHLVGWFGWTSADGDSYVLVQDAMTRFSSFGTRAAGWHELTMVAHSATGTATEGTLSVCVDDTDCSDDMPLTEPIDGFSFRDEGFDAYIDNLYIFTD